MSAPDSRLAVPAAAPEAAPEGKDTCAGSAVQGTAEREALARVVEDHDTVAGMVRRFHEAFGVAIDQHATAELRQLRADLLGEECGEARYALLAEDLPAIAKELADVVIVAYGAAVTFGINLDVAVALVHESNMSKLVNGRPVMRTDGKVLKGPNYQPPDMSGCVARAALQALRGDTAWVPGDPGHPDEVSRRWCMECLAGWTGGPEQCPTCGCDSVPGCASCGARDGCPACVTQPEEGR